MWMSLSDTGTIMTTWLQVLMSDSPEAQQHEASSSATQNSAQQSSSEIPSTSASSASAAAASGPTPQSGSHALRIASNPNLSGPPPMFVKQPMQQQADERSSGADDASSGSGNQASSSQVGGAMTAGNVQQPQAEGGHQAHPQPTGRGIGRQAEGSSRQRSIRPPRLQHDDPFLAYDITVA